MRHNTGKYQGRSDLDLELERRGTMGDLTAEDRAAFARVAELTGCEVAGRHIRDAARRRSQVHAVPDDQRKPLASGNNRPLLHVLDGNAGSEFDPDRSFWLDLRRACDRHDSRYLSLPGQVVLDALGDALRANLP